MLMEFSLVYIGFHLIVLPGLNQFTILNTFSVIWYYPNYFSFFFSPETVITVKCGFAGF